MKHLKTTRKISTICTTFLLFSLGALLIAPPVFAGLFAGVKIKQEFVPINQEITVAKGTPIALVIGNNDYQYIPSLKNAVNDATDMANVLKQLGFEVILKTDLNKLQMEYAINEFGHYLSQSQGVGLFYYAGQGSQVKGYNYLLPIDIDGWQPSHSSRWDIHGDTHVYRNAVVVDKILNTMTDAKSSKNIIILDACFTGGKNLGLAKMHHANSFIAFAAAPDKTASDLSQGNNGLYTYHLLKELKRASQTHLRIEDMFTRVRQAVNNESKGIQNPWFLPLLEEPFCFGGCQVSWVETRANWVNTKTNCENLTEYEEILEESEDTRNFSLVQTFENKLTALISDISLPIEKKRQYANDIRGIKANPNQWQSQLKQKLYECFGENSNIKGKYYALVIGINDYEHLKDLHTARQDALEVAQVLKKQYGFTIFKRLLDQDATYKNILDTFSDLERELKKTDHLLIYYAGHGYNDKKAKSTYWQPTDTRKGYQTEWISNSTITEHLRRINANNILIVADSCYSGTFQNYRIDDDLEENKQRRHVYLRKTIKKPSRVLIASGGDEPVSDKGGKGHSIFAQAFLDSLRNMEEEAFTARELFGKIEEPVAGSSEQEPEFGKIRNSGHKGGDFVFQRQ